MLRVETTNLPIPRGTPRSRRLLPNPPSPKRHGLIASRHEMLPPRDEEASDVTETVSLASPSAALVPAATLAPAAPLDRWSVRLELADDDIAKLYGQGMTRGAVVWRKGMHEWRPLLITPELSGLLRRTRTTLSETPPVPYVSEELTVPRPARLPSDFPAVAVAESVPPPPSSEKPRFTTVAPTALDVAMPERSTGRRRVELAAVAVAAFALAWLTHGRLQSGDVPPPSVPQVAAASAAGPAPACEPTPATHPERATSSSSIPTVAVADLPLVGQKAATSEANASMTPSRGATGSAPARGASASARSTRSDPSRPSRSELSSALSRVAGAASGCGERGGPVRVMMTFAPSGVARSIQVSGAGLPAQTRSCIFGAASRARVPAFSGDPVTVSKTL